MATSFLKIVDFHSNFLRIFFALAIYLLHPVMSKTNVSHSKCFYFLRSCLINSGNHVHILSPNLLRVHVPAQAVLAIYGTGWEEENRTRLEVESVFKEIK
jgi:hypothetical protein